MELVDSPGDSRTKVHSEAGSEGPRAEKLSGIETGWALLLVWSSQPGFPALLPHFLCSFGQLLPLTQASVSPSGKWGKSQLLLKTVLL